MRPIPSLATAEYILTPHAVARRVRHGTQPAVWTLHVIGEEVATFEDHPAGGPALSGVSEDLVAEVAATLAGDSGADYTQTARAAVLALTRLSQDISAVDDAQPTTDDGDDSSDD